MDVQVCVPLLCRIQDNLGCSCCIRSFTDKIRCWQTLTAKYSTYCLERLWVKEDMLVRGGRVTCVSDRRRDMYSIFLKARRLEAVAEFKTRTNSISRISRVLLKYLIHQSSTCPTHFSSPPKLSSLQNQSQPQVVLLALWQAASQSKSHPVSKPLRISIHRTHWRIRVDRRKTRQLKSVLSFNPLLFFYSLSDFSDPTSRFSNS